MMTYTVPRSTYDTIGTLHWPEDKDMSAAGGGAGLARLMFGGAEYVVGNEIKISSKAFIPTRQLIRKISSAASRIRSRVRARHDRCRCGCSRGPWSSCLAGHRGVQGETDLLFARKFHFRERPQPADSYELLGLDGDSLPSDYFSKRSKNDTTRFPADCKYWQSVVAEVVYNNNRTL